VFSWIITNKLPTLLFGPLTWKLYWSWKAIDVFERWSVDGKRVDVKGRPTENEMPKLPPMNENGCRLPQRPCAVVELPNTVEPEIGLQSLAESINDWTVSTKQRCLPVSPKPYSPNLGNYTVRVVAVDLWKKSYSVSLFNYICSPKFLLL